jgi:hypothetical protein
VKTGLGNSLNLGSPLGTERQPLRLTPEDRSKHLYVVGSSGQGKSKFLEGLVRQDITNWPASGSGLLLIDPDGPIFDGVMDWLSRKATVAERPVIPIDFRRKDVVVSYNPLRHRPGVESSVVVNNFVSAVAHVWGDDSVERTPLFARYAKSLIQALYERGGSVADAILFFDHAAKAERLALIQQIQDGDSRAVWEHVHGLSPSQFMDELGSTIRRLHPFTYNRFLRAVFGNGGPSLDLMEALEQGQIILVCLAQEGGNIDQTDAKLFATTLLADLWQTAGQRGKGDGVKPFYVYIDEFQEYLTPTIATTFARARGYGLHFTLAHQFPSQVIESGEIGKRVFDSIVANADTVVAFQQKHPEDVERVAKLLFGSGFDPFREKLRIDSTKVVAYKKIILRATSRSESSGSTTSGTSSSELFDDEGNSSGISESTSATESLGATSESSSEHESLAPVLGKELSSVQFLSIDEQLHLAIVALQTQGKRHAVARIAGAKHPVTLRTEEMPEPSAGKHVAEEYQLRLLGKLPMAIAFESALTALESRHETLRASLLGQRFGNDTPAKRRLTKK